MKMTWQFIKLNFFVRFGIIIPKMLPIQLFLTLFFVTVLLPLTCKISNKPNIKWMGQGKRLKHFKICVF